MTDIKERLRNEVDRNVALYEEAADRIEELEAKVERLNKIWKYWYDQAQEELSNQIKAEKRIEELEGAGVKLLASLDYECPDHVCDFVTAPDKGTCPVHEAWGRLWGLVMTDD